MTPSDRLIRAVARMLAPARSESQRMRDVRALRGQFRLAGIFMLTVALPALALAWIGFQSIRGEELSVFEAVREQSDLEIRDLMNDGESIFMDFEENVRGRLESGRSPLDNTGTLSPYLQVAFRLDRSGVVKAPFDPVNVPPLLDNSFYFSQSWRGARAAEQAGSYELATGLFGHAATQARSIHELGDATYARGRVLLKAGYIDEANVLFTEVVSDFGDVRNLQGFRLGDLARLKRGELLLAKDPAVGGPALESLTEELLEARWPMGVGGHEAAVAARAVELLEEHSDSDWLARSRGRLEEKTARLFWAEQLAPELPELNPDGRALPVSRGEFKYQTLDKALWATMWWGESSDDYYAFALDVTAIEARLDELARRATRTSIDVNMLVVAPDEDPPADTLARRSLNPYLPGWQLAVHPRDTAALDRLRTKKRAQRVSILLLAVVMITTGAVLSARLVGRELEVARTKTDFAANISHELRSPITQIRVKGEALQFGLIEAEDLPGTYDSIVRESERLSRLVDNVLDFAAIERGSKRYMFRAAAIGDTVQSAVDAARYSMEVRDMEIDVDLPMSLPVTLHDPEAIAQVMHNLVSNASKYGKDAGWIGVTGQLEPGGVAISVTDRGIGIADHEIPQLFDHFFRSSSPDARRQKGTGIGLTIVRYIVEAHGGTIEVRSEMGVGSTFTIHLPLTPPQQPRK